MSIFPPTDMSILIVPVLLIVWFFINTAVDHYNTDKELQQSKKYIRELETRLSKYEPECKSGCSCKARLGQKIGQSNNS